MTTSTESEKYEVLETIGKYSRYSNRSFIPSLTNAQGEDHLVQSGKLEGYQMDMYVTRHSVSYPQWLLTCDPDIMSERDPIHQDVPEGARAAPC